MMMQLAIRRRCGDSSILSLRLARPAMETLIAWPLGASAASVARTDHATGLTPPTPSCQSCRPEVDASGTRPGYAGRGLGARC
jgi:hypothetical protein